MEPIIIYMYVTVGLFALVIGSFLNVCILRIPQGKTVVTEPSHCPSCKKRLRPWELIPLFSYLALRGKCGQCKAHISLQYPLIEGGNVLLWLMVIFTLGFTPEAILACILSSALLTLSVIDARTREIPFCISVFIFILGVANTAFNYQNYLDHLIGFGVVTAVLLLILIVSGGGAIGGGDVKMMMGCSLFLGLSQSFLAVFLACLIGSIIHIIRMKFFGAKRDLAMGPYLSVGVYLSIIIGDPIINWYLALSGL